MVIKELFQDLPWEAVILSAQLAGISTLILLVIATPLAWWLTRTRSILRAPIEAITALPLVLPPTVLGFYLLVFLAPDTAIGGAWVRLTGEALTFSFSGLIIASVIYSFPFAVQPLQTAFQSIRPQMLETATLLGASPWSRFWTVVVPFAKRGFLTAAVLSFAHTLGEFGVVLMVGGNIPGETRVIAVEIYNAVETLDYATAHRLSALLIAVSFVVLITVYLFGGRARPRVR